MLAYTKCSRCRKGTFICTKHKHTTFCQAVIQRQITQSDFYNTFSRNKNQTKWFLLIWVRWIRIWNQKIFLSAQFRDNRPFIWSKHTNHHFLDFNFFFCKTNLKEILLANIKLNIQSVRIQRIKKLGATVKDLELIRKYPCFGSCLRMTQESQHSVKKSSFLLLLCKY